MQLPPLSMVSISTVTSRWSASARVYIMASVANGSAAVAVRPLLAERAVWGVRIPPRAKVSSMFSCGRKTRMREPLMTYSTTARCSPALYGPGLGACREVRWPRACCALPVRSTTRRWTGSVVALEAHMPRPASLAATTAAWSSSYCDERSSSARWRITSARPSSTTTRAAFLRTLRTWHMTVANWRGCMPSGPARSYSTDTVHFLPRMRWRRASRASWA
mmetsp:Transcript_19763/g.49947  ORF Transcript_19763/g.49947 Transcript_19763/m.49947 type:complete len:220 (-) Transcript_19763:143-802(-)